LATTGQTESLSERAISDSKLGALAILGPSPKKARLVEKALLRKKHVLVDFPAAQRVEEARKLAAIASGKELCIYSPNLLIAEPGLQELKHAASRSTGKLLSLTITCGLNAKLSSPNFTMKVAQLLDLAEWLGGAKFKDVCAEKSVKGSRAAALVALASFDNGIKAMLNMYSAPVMGHGRLWVDGVFEDSVVHVDPYAQSIRIAAFHDKSTKSVSWATASLIAAIEDFIDRINAEKEPLDLENLGRMLNLARMVAGNQGPSWARKQAA
jgi:predicted dehydrogenase